MSSKLKNKKSSDTIQSIFHILWGKTMKQGGSYLSNDRKWMPSMMNKDKFYLTDFFYIIFLIPFRHQIKCNENIDSKNFFHSIFILVRKVPEI